MVKADILKEFAPTIRFENGASVTLDGIQRLFADYAKKMGIPARFSRDEVVSGSLLNKTKEECVVISHPKHETDYLRFYVRVKRQGQMAFVCISSGGKSEQMAKAEKADAQRKAGKICGAVITSLGHNRAKYEEEQIYYECIRRMCSCLVA